MGQLRILFDFGNELFFILFVTVVRLNNFIYFETILAFDFRKNSTSRLNLEFRSFLINLLLLLQLFHKLWLGISKSNSSSFLSITWIILWFSECSQIIDNCIRLLIRSLFCILSGHSRSCFLFEVTWFVCLNWLLSLVLIVRRSWWCSGRDHVGKGRSCCGLLILLS